MRALGMKVGIALLALGMTATTVASLRADVAIADEPGATTTTTSEDPGATTTSTTSATTTAVTTTTVDAAATTTSSSTTSTTSSATTSTTVPGPQPPGRPLMTSLAATGVGALTATFQAAGEDGGAPIDGYVVEYSTWGGPWILSGVAESAGVPWTISGLANGTRHFVRVSARNSVGTSAPSAFLGSNTWGVPGAPRMISAAPSGPRQVRVTFAKSTSNGGSTITTYVVERSTHGGPWTRASITGNPLSGSVTVTGLANGTRYYFRARAVNAVGASPPSGHLPTTTLGVPGAARIVSAKPGPNRVTVSWAPPASNGGTAVTRYVVQRSTSASSGWQTISQPSASTRSLTSTGLINGRRYYFRVAAANAVGLGPWSASASAVPVPAVAPPPPPSCHPSYVGVCLPPSGPDLDCGDIPAKRFRVVGPDTHRLDGDNDGIACES